jgi:hypothetical protein
MPQHMIVLEYDGYQAPIYVDSVAEMTSVHSGRALKTVQGSLRANGKDVASTFQSAVAAKVPISGVDSQTRVRAPWHVGISSYSISDDHYSFNVTLQEAENLEVDVLVLNGTEVVPRRYAEKTYGEGIEVEALVHMEGEALDVVRTLITTSHYFPVVRKGISDAPVQMRFGMCGWSAEGAGRLYHLILVDRRSDREDKNPSIVDHERLARRQTLIFRAELLERLLKRLVQKGVLTVGEVEELKREAQDAAPERAENLFSVPDAAILM